MAKDIGINPGDVFGRLTVIERTVDYICKDGKHKSQYLCECSCPEHTRVVVIGTALKSGNKRSCGCYQRECAAKVGKANYTYGISHTPVAQAYYNMMSRCYYPGYDHYENYGGRGISVCDWWREDKVGVKRFYDDMAPTYFEGASLDRINPDGNYEPSNCRWVDYRTQGNNIRNNRLVTVNGETFTASEWNYALGYTKDKVRNRLELGWTDEEAVFGKTPFAPGNNNGGTMMNAIYFINRFGRPVPPGDPSLDIE